MKKFAKIISLLCIVAVLISAVSVNAYAIEPNHLSGYDESGALCYFLPIDSTTASLETYLSYSEDIVIPSVVGGYTITSIEPEAFKDSTIESVTIPNTVKTIGPRAFEFCYNLTTVTLPSSLTVIEENLFHGDWIISEIVIPDGIKEIKKDAFASCESLSKITIPPSVTKIADKSVGFENYDYYVKKDITIFGYINSTAYKYAKKHSFNFEAKKITGLKTKPAKRKATITWSPINKASKYVVKYSPNKNMKGAKTKTVKKPKVVLKKLTSKKNIYVQVQGFVGKAKTDWSTKKKVKIK